MKAASGKIIIIVAPSGSGKSTLIVRLKKEFPQLAESVSFTTRPMRTGEVHGKNYFYIGVQEFEQKIKQGDFLEWAKVHSNYYGTSKEFVETGLKEGKQLLFDVDVQGADSFKQTFGDKALAIFIEPPSLQVLEERLKKRATDSPAVIQERVNNAKKELLRRDDFDFLLMNDDLEKAYGKLKDIVQKILKG